MLIKSFGQFNREDPASGNLFLLEVATADLIPDRIELLSKYFVCLIVWNSLNERDDVLHQVAQKLLRNGAVYICAFGDGCQKLHDVIDDEIISQELEDNTEATSILTTWHSSEPFDDALWYFLYTTHPADAYEKDCNSWLLVSIGDHDYSSTVRTAFDNPDNFNDAVLAKMPDDTEDE